MDSEIWLVNWKPTWEAAMMIMSSPNYVKMTEVKFGLQRHSTYKKTGNKLSEIVALRLGTLGRADHQQIL